MYIRGTEINKVDFEEIEQLIEELGMDVKAVYNVIADDNGMCYISNGFLRGLNRGEIEEGEWHHFFVKVDGEFEARKFCFQRQIEFV